MILPIFLVYVVLSYVLNFLFIRIMVTTDKTHCPHILENKNYVKMMVIFFLVSPMSWFLGLCCLPESSLYQSMKTWFSNVWVKCKAGCLNNIWDAIANLLFKGLK